MKKENFKNIVNNELIPLNITYHRENASIDLVYQNLNDINELKSHINQRISLMTNIFFTFNTILVKLKKSILDNNGSSRSSMIDKTFGKKNGNNVYSLICYIENNSYIKFDEDFTFFICIVETLIRHQHAHSFTSSIYEFLDNFSRNGYLVFNKNQWKKYVNQEGNNNLFYLYTSSIFDNSDLINSTYPYIFLNSRRAREFLQLKSFENQEKQQQKLLEHYKNNNLKFDIVLRDYKLQAVNLMSCQDFITNISPIVEFFQNAIDLQSKNKYKDEILMKIKKKLVFYNKTMDTKIERDLSNLLSTKNKGSFNNILLHFISKFNQHTIKEIFFVSYKKWQEHDISYLKSKIEDVFHLQILDTDLPKLEMCSDKNIKDNSNITCDYFLSKSKIFISYYFDEEYYIPIAINDLVTEHLNRDTNIIINHKTIFEKIDTQCRLISLSLKD